MAGQPALIDVTNPLQQAAPAPVAQPQAAPAPAPVAPAAAPPQEPGLSMDKKVDFGNGEVLSLRELKDMHGAAKSLGLDDFENRSFMTTVSRALQDDPAAVAQLEHLVAQQAPAVAQPVAPQAAPIPAQPVAQPPSVIGQPAPAVSQPPSPALDTDRLMAAFKEAMGPMSNSVEMLMTDKRAETRADQIGKLKTHLTKDDSATPHLKMAGDAAAERIYNEWTALQQMRANSKQNPPTNVELQEIITREENYIKAASPELPPVEEPINVVRMDQHPGYVPGVPVPERQGYANPTNQPLPAGGQQQVSTQMPAAGAPAGPAQSAPAKGPMTVQSLAESLNQQARELSNQ